MRLLILVGVLGLARVAAADAPDVARLTATGRNLASNGYCDAVKQLARQVRALDEHYYTTVFATDPVITSCGALPKQDEKPAVDETPSANAEHHGLTYDVEVGGGFGGYEYETTTTSTAGAWNTAAGVGVFVSPSVAIGVRGVTAFSRSTALTYRLPAPANEGLFTPNPNPITTVHAKVSNEIAVLDAQIWHGDSTWVGVGFGVGRLDLAPDLGHATVGFATDLRWGVAAPYGHGLEASIELTSITANVGPTSSDSTTQFGFAFLVGWQHL